MLLSLFEDIGIVKSFDIKRKPFQPAFAFIDMDSTKEASNAIDALNNMVLDGFTLFVTYHRGVKSRRGSERSSSRESLEFSRDIDDFGHFGEKISRRKRKKLNIDFSQQKIQSMKQNFDSFGKPQKK